MKKLLIILAVGGMGSPAFADITHRMSSSLSLTTNAAATQVERIGSTYSVSGSGDVFNIIIKWLKSQFFLVRVLFKKSQILPFLYVFYPPMFSS